MPTSNLRWRSCHTEGLRLAEPHPRAASCHSEGALRGIFSEASLAWDDSLAAQVTPDVDACLILSVALCLFGKAHAPHRYLSDSSWRWRRSRLPLPSRRAAIQPTASSEPARSTSAARERSGAIWESSSRTTLRGSREVASEALYYSELYSWERGVVQCCAEILPYLTVSAES